MLTGCRTELQCAPRDPHGFLRGLPESRGRLPRRGRGLPDLHPSGRPTDRTALVLLCATDTEALATRASWRSAQQSPDFAARRIWPKNRKRKYSQRLKATLLRTGCDAKGEFLAFSRFSEFPAVFARSAHLSITLGASNFYNQKIADSRQKILTFSAELVYKSW